MLISVMGKSDLLTVNLRMGCPLGLAGVASRWVIEPHDTVADLPRLDHVPPRPRR